MDTHTRTHRYPEMDPIGSLLKASSSRKGELETRAILDLSASCGLRRSGSVGLEPTTMPLQVPGTEDERRTPTNTSADKAASTSRQGQAIPDDPAGKPQLPPVGSRRSIIHSPSRGEGTPSHNPPPSLLDGFGTRSARCPGDWPKGAPSPLIGLGGRGGRHGGPPLKQEDE